MALQSFTITIGALTDAGNNGKNYVNNQPVYIKKTNGTLASIYRDLAGTSQIAQDGLSNVTNSKGQFTFFVDAGDYNAEYQSQVTPITVVGADYFNSRIDETVNQVILDLSTSRGFRVKGTFAAGFTYELPNDVGLDASGNAWIYTDVEALPFTVPAATTPSWPTYTQVTFNQASNISYAENGNVENALRKRASYYTLAEAQAADLEVGQYVVLTDRKNGLAKVNPAGVVADGFGVAPLPNGTSLQVQKTPDGHINADHCGAVGDGTTPDAEAFISAINISTGNKVVFSNGPYLIDKQLLITSGCTGLKGQGEIDSVLLKGFDGNLIRSINQGATFEEFWIQGAAATYSGGGYYMEADNCHIKHVRVTDTQDACVIFKGGEAAFNTVKDSFLLTVNANSPAIRSDGADPIQSPTARDFVRIKGGGPLVNFAGMNRATLSESFGTYILLDATADKIGLHNNRFTVTDRDILLLGNGHSISGNLFGFAGAHRLKVGAGAAGINYGDSNSITVDGSTNISIIDLNPKGDEESLNSLSTTLLEYPTSWGGDTTYGAFGSSTVSCWYKREHKLVSFNFSMVRAADATLPTGDWFIQLPFKAVVTASGAFTLKSSSGIWQAGTWVVQGGSSRLYMYLHAQSAALDETQVAFGTSGEMLGSIVYQIR
jgi:hypothetical protein